MISPKSMPGYWFLRKEVLGMLEERPMTLRDLTVKLDGWKDEDVKQMICILRRGVIRTVAKQRGNNVYGVD
jgi:hypothetical protein